MATIAEALNTIANIARMRIDLAGEDVETAITETVEVFAKEAMYARNRINTWARSKTEDEIEEAGFYGSVANDVRRNQHRPTVGPARDYVRALLAV